MWRVFLVFLSELMCPSHEIEVLGIAKYGYYIRKTNIFAQDTSDLVYIGRVVLCTPGTPVGQGGLSLLLCKIAPHKGQQAIAVGGEGGVPRRRSGDGARDITTEAMRGRAHKTAPCRPRGATPREAATLVAESHYNP